MSTRILEWIVPIDDQEHQIGDGPVVHVGQQGNPREVCVWTLEPDPLRVTPAPKRRHLARVIGTGQPFDGWMWTPRGSVIDNEAGLVWHVLTRWVNR